MPMMICATDRVVETNLGHVLGFKKNVPLHVPKFLVSAVMERGAFPANGEQAATTEATEIPLTDKQLEPTDSEARHARLVEAIKSLTASGTLMFTSGGKPNPAQLGKTAGFRIDATERDEAWAVAQKTAD